MKTTSHFIGIPLKSAILSDIFTSIYTYVNNHQISDIIQFQNPLSPHITLYYPGSEIDIDTKKQVQNTMKIMPTNQIILADSIDYFYRGVDKYILFLNIQTKLQLPDINNHLHSTFNRFDILENSLPFHPHITILKIKNPDIFEKHRENIEAIIIGELQKINTIDLNENELALYRVNSHFPQEIQIKL